MSSWDRGGLGGYRPDVVRVALGAVLASALLLPGVARAELLPGSQGAQDALLAVAPDGSPRVAFVAADGSLQVAARAVDGTWSAQTLAGLPGSRALVVGLSVAPSGAASLLAEDPAGHWLPLGGPGQESGASPMRRERVFWRDLVLNGLRVGLG